MTTERSAQASAKVPRNGEKRRQGAGDQSRERLLAWMPVTERRLQLANIATSVLEGGDGPPVVLLHGPLANAAHWVRVVPGLVSARRVIAPDLPGHGATEAGAAPLNIERMLEWLAALIETTCSSPPALVGQLLGGALALRFAIAHGKRIEQLILVDTFGLTPFQPPAEFGQALTQYIGQPNEATHENLWRQCTFDFDSVRLRMAERWEPFATYNVELARKPSVQSAVSALMEQFAPAIPESELARNAVPTTLIWGRHDRPYPLAVAEAANARYGWPLHVIENSADDPPIEQPEALVRVLRGLLDKSDRNSKGEIHA
ncbi:MAG TPA: alpha/beta hydrolase [Steroidobacteraceae bacterium]|nr:alpha/beta hydrolase [Steroidobacteraceae bacterium]